MNTPKQIGNRFDVNKLSWWPVILFVPARFVFAFIAQGFTAWILYLQGSVDPWFDAAAWWPLYSTITDILCLLALTWLVKYEGIRLADLMGADTKSALKQLKFTPLFLLLAAPFAVLASVITRAFYGEKLPPMIEVVDLPFSAAIYALIVWPIIWVIVEQVVYLGYLLPRLEVLTRKTWLAGLIVALVWGGQHFAIPFLADGEYLLSRVLAATAATTGFVVAYLVLRRRLIAAIGAHWIADVATAFMAAIVPLLYVM